MVAIIIITVLLFLALIGFIVFIILKRRSLTVEEKKPKKEYKPIVKEKPQKVVLSPEEKEEKKQKQYSSRIIKCSELGLRRGKEFSLEEDENGVEAVGIVYNEKSRMYMFNPNGEKLNVGDVVIVLDLSNTRRMVSIVMANKMISENDIVKPFKDILEVVYRTDKTASNIAVVDEEIVNEQKDEEPVEKAHVEEETTAQEEVEEVPAEEPKDEEVAPVEEKKVEEETEPETAEVQEETTQEEVQQENVVEETQNEEENIPEEPVQEPEKVEEAPAEETKDEEVIPVAQEETTEEDDEESEESEDEDDSDDTEEASDSKSASSPQATEVVFDEATKKYRIIKTKRTYECKISMLSDDVKKYYDTLRNRLLSYDFKCSQTKTCEKFKVKRDTVAILKVIGKQVSLYLALNPSDFVDTKYKGKDLSEKVSYKATPFQYKTKTERKTNWAVELIDMLAKKYGFEQNPNAKDEKFARAIPSMTEEELIEKGYLIKTETVVDEAPKGFVKFVEE